MKSRIIATIERGTYCASGNGRSGDCGDPENGGASGGGTEENIDNQLLTEVSSRVIGNLRRRADGRNDVESSVQEENLERRFRLAALRSERAELYHLRATREISNETLQKLARISICLKRC
ncbi:hypothetical protein ACVXG8_05245 [Escherichia coli]